MLASMRPIIPSTVSPLSHYPISYSGEVCLMGLPHVSTGYSVVEGPGLSHCEKYSVILPPPPSREAGAFRGEGYYDDIRKAFSRIPDPLGLLRGIALEIEREYPEVGIGRCAASFIRTDISIALYDPDSERRRRAIDRLGHLMKATRDGSRLSEKELEQIRDLYGDGPKVSISWIRKAEKPLKRRVGCNTDLHSWLEDVVQRINGGSRVDSQYAPWFGWSLRSLIAGRFEKVIHDAYHHPSERRRQENFGVIEAVLNILSKNDCFEKEVVTHDQLVQLCRHLMWRDALKREIRDKSFLDLMAEKMRECSGDASREEKDLRERTALLFQRNLGHAYFHPDPKVRAETFLRAKNIIGRNPSFHAGFFFTFEEIREIYEILISSVPSASARM